jgi:hypothetical protein
MADPIHANWHYPRTELANKILKGFQVGLAERFTIFAPRKRGKTEFVQRDVAPLAKEQGILVVYVDFWRDKASPAMAFATAVMAARREQESWFTNLLSQSTLKASLNLFGNDLSMELSPQKKQAEKKLQKLPSKSWRQPANRFYCYLMRFSIWRPIRRSATLPRLYAAL